MTGTMQGRVVLVTGGGTGIGLATARACAAAGAEAVISGRRAEVLDAVATGGPRLHPVAADVTDLAAVRGLADMIGARFGRLDVLVNNAATTGGGALAALDDAAVAAVVATNLLGPLRVTNACLPLLLATRGVVVNVSASGDGRGWPGASAYAATKAGLDALTRSWAVELAADGVRVVGVAPGAVDTPIGEHAGLSATQVAALRGWQVDRTPLGRVGAPDDVARAVVAMAGEEAGFITGATLVVDGGAAVA